MLSALGRTTLLVRDYDEALAFYRDALGLAVLHDSTGPGEQRYLHLGVPGQPGEPAPGLWMLRPTSEGDVALIGRQAGDHPFLVFYTSDCAGTLAEWVSRGVRVKRAPREEGGAVFVHVEDCYGNDILLVERITEGAD
jgi:catechol 2,3-dioxygenase-like lactoylglutathione lyase family enzyme